MWESNRRLKNRVKGSQATLLTQRTLNHHGGACKVCLPTVGEVTRWVTTGHFRVLFDKPTVQSTVSTVSLGPPYQSVALGTMSREPLGSPRA